ncbi:DJ-1/PfpI family protein [Pseudomonas sp. H2_H03]
MTHGSSKGGTTQTFVGDTEKDKTVESDVQLSDVLSSDFDALVIPGGTVNADTLRQDAAALRLIKEFADAGKTIAAICHGPWTLIDAGVVQGKTLTSYKSVRIDLENAGARRLGRRSGQGMQSQWLDLDHLARTPDDLPAFNTAIAQALAG